MTVPVRLLDPVEDNLTVVDIFRMSLIQVKTALEFNQSINQSINQPAYNGRNSPGKSIGQ